MSPADDEDDRAGLARLLAGVGRAAGLDEVGFAGAEPFDDVRRTLEARRGRGLSGGMAFTYRNPARSTDPSRALPGARSLVVGARSYLRRDPQESGDAGADVPTRHAAGAVARYSWEDHYAPLRRGLEAVAGELEQRGWRARVLVDDNALVDRAAAHRAGLGWWGKNTNLLLPGRGSWFVLGSVVTDAPLPAEPAPAADQCGACTRCLTACPTGALVEPGVLDARRCLAWLLEAPGPFPREHRVALGGRIYGCDDCQEVCPPNRAAERREPPPPAPPGAEPWVDLVDLLATPDDELLRRLGRWYIPRREARYLRRNALIALGNVGDPGSAAVRRAVETALVSNDAIVRGHAVWAARRLGLDDLVDDLAATETDAYVLEEVGAAVPRR
ncbi:MAG TPA: tRNA epoxyqueuosine(34) reductase QueG [Acidimicrobiales bacterium]|nr:tRNA epoxyqueuosine(34) reductase QueG [Acidimicrobiales bacterium]